MRDEQMTKAERDQLLDHTRVLRETERRFMISEGLETLRQQLAATPELEKAAQLGLKEIQDEIGQRGLARKAKSYEVHHEREVARERFLLELHETGSVEEAAERTRKRLDPAELRSATEAAALARQPKPAAEAENSFEP